MQDSRPLSIGQEALWFLYRMAPDSPAYNVQGALRIRAHLDDDRLRQALRAVVDRHDVLRSTIAETAAGPRRLVGPPNTVALAVRDVPEAGAEELVKWVREFGEAPFDLSGRGTCRALLLRRAPDDVVLVVATHHIVTDATSQWLLLQDLLDAYTAPEEAQLPPLRRGYDDYVAAEQRTLSGPRREQLRSFWAEFCGAAPAGELPMDRPRPQVRALFDGATCELRVPDRLVPRLRHTAQQTGVTTFALLLGVFQSFIHRYSGEPGFLVGCPTTTRTGPGMRQVVGYLVNTLTLPAHFGPATTFAGAAAAAQRHVLAAMKHGAYPYALLAGESRYTSRNPPARIAFTMVAPSRLEPLLQLVTEAAATGGEAEYRGLPLSLVDVPQMEGQFDISVEMRQSESALTAVFRYATDLFDEETVRQFLDHYVELLAAAVEDPNALVAGTSLLDDAELGALLALGTADD
ncbi:condensation domain-containing protein [Streptomyces antimycoticus]|uniref:condensation domain-containing protein n=1 Tax=Streptomyces antimycoticus TaxID=68175 RepID=UPI000A3ACE85|nr:condensation domain-containing protein [Streptomyces antimycoticus]